MNELKITVEIPGLEKLVAEMRKQNELLSGPKVVVNQKYKEPEIKESETKEPETQPVPAAEDNDESDSKVAGRRTYIFFKDTKTGAVIEKGEEVPTHDGATGVSKTKWEKLCDKYNLDPETGDKLEYLHEDDDLDLDEPESQPETTSDESDNDDDLDLGLDDDSDAGETLTIDDVKPVLIKVMKSQGRETVLKILKKYGASNVENIKPEDFGAIKADAEKALAA